MLGGNSQSPNFPYKYNYKHKPPIHNNARHPYQKHKSIFQQLSPARRDHDRGRQDHKDRKRHPCIKRGPRNRRRRRAHAQRDWYSSSCSAVARRSKCYNINLTCSLAFTEKIMLNRSCYYILCIIKVLA